MSKDNVIAFENPSSKADDPLTEVLRRGASKLLAQAIEAEVETLVAQYTDRRDEQGRQAVVRNGYLPERQVQTGLGQVAVKVPRVRDRSKSGIRFHSSILPPYLRRSRSIEELLPWLYLKGISSGDFSEALASLLGPDAPGLSATTISRLKQVWQDELAQWQRRDLSGKHYVYIWADAVYFGTRLETAHQCILVIMGATETGEKELVGIWDGYAESEQSWKELLLDLKHHGLTQEPVLAIGDGALGFWAALPRCMGTPSDNAVGSIRRQTCWTSCLRTGGLKPSTVCNRFGCLRIVKGQNWPSTCLSPPMSRSIPKPANVCPKTERRCWRSTIIRLSIGCIFARPMRSNRRFRRYVCERIKRVDVSHERRR